ncbi:esterase, partial [Streptomyces albidoflavus]
MNDTAEATGHPAPDEQDPAPEPVAVHGTVAPGYEPVRDAFARNFAQLGDRGAAVTVHRHGTPVV